MPEVQGPGREWLKNERKSFGKCDAGYSRSDSGNEARVPEKIDKGVKGTTSLASTSKMVPSVGYVPIAVVSNESHWWLQRGPDALGGWWVDGQGARCTVVLCGSGHSQHCCHLLSVRCTRQSIIPKQNWPLLVPRRARLRQALSALRPTKAYQKSRNVLGNTNIGPGVQKHAR